MLLNQKLISQAHKTRGYLQKKSSGFISIWQRRYFMILNNCLSYYADETLEEVKKTIELSQINSIKMVEDTEFHLVTKKRIYELRADKQSNRDLWVASLNILTSQKQIKQSPNSKLIQFNQTKIVPTRPHSRPKKKETSGYSPPPIRKMSSMIDTGSKLENECSEQTIFLRMGQPKLSSALKQEHVRNKIILIRQKQSCYFIVCCKTPLYSHEDYEYLSEDLVSPLRLNTLYFFQPNKIECSQAVQMCKCSQISAIQEGPKNLILILNNKEIIVEPNHKKMQISEIISLPKRLAHAIQMSKQYFNTQGIKIRRNIDKILYKYESKEMLLNEIVKKEMQKCMTESKEGYVKNQFRKNLEMMRKTIKEIISCCEVLEKSRAEFKDKFVKEFYLQTLSYVHKTWTGLQKTYSISEQKKILMILYDFWRSVKDIVKDNKMFEGALAMHKQLVQKYEAEIISKIDSCFSLKQSQILEQVKLDIKGDSQIIEQMNKYFYSNNIYRQFHIDIRLVLYEFHEMPVHEKILEGYLTLFRNVFKHIAEQTFKFIDKWKNPKLILGTCNEIEFIKNSLFEQMYQKLTEDYKQLGKKIKSKNIRQLQSEICNTQILLVKNLFVNTFSTIDREMLSKNFDQLEIKEICGSIIKQLESFTKINKYVKRNIFQASFQEICYFYYSNIIKFNRQNEKIHQNAEFFAKKIASDINSIGHFFEGHLHSQKIYAHFKDLTLLKEFIQCDLSQVKKICSNLKKEFGNSFTETAVSNLLSLRDMNPQIKDNIAIECNEIVKSSGDSPLDISMVSSSMQSFLDNWNNVRSRKSTLTLSVNEFYQNQHTIYQNKYNCSVWKQGYLIKKKISKGSTASEARSFFQINHSRMEQYQNESQDELMTVYELHKVKRCFLHPEKNYIFIVEFPDFKLQFKAETSDEAKEWIKNIYEEIGTLSSLKEIPIEKERPSQLNLLDFHKDPSTMESLKTMKDRSLEKSLSGSPMLKKPKRVSDKKELEISPEKQIKLSKQSKLKAQKGQDNCFQCSKGFFF